MSPQIKKYRSTLLTLGIVIIFCFLSEKILAQGTEKVSITAEMIRNQVGNNILPGITIKSTSSSKNGFLTMKIESISGNGASNTALAFDTIGGESYYTFSLSLAEGTPQKKSQIKISFSRSISKLALDSYLNINNSGLLNLNTTPLPVGDSNLTYDLNRLLEKPFGTKINLPYQRSNNLDNVLNTSFLIVKGLYDITFLLDTDATTNCLNQVGTNCQRFSNGHVIWGLKDIGMDIPPNQAEILSAYLIEETDDKNSMQNLRLAYNNANQPQQDYNLKLRMEILDVDTGEIEYEIRDTRDIKNKTNATLLHFDKSPYATRTTIDTFKMVLHQNINGPKEQIIKIKHPQNPLANSFDITIFFDGAKWPGFEQNLSGWYKVEKKLINQLINTSISNNDKIEKWFDFSGKKNHLGQSLSSSQPLFSEKDSKQSINDFSTISFSGNEHLTTEKELSTWNFDSDMTVLSIFRSSKVVSGAVFGNSDGAGTNRGLFSSDAEINAIGAGNHKNEVNINQLFKENQPSLISIGYAQEIVNGSYVRASGEEVHRFTSFQSVSQNPLQVGNIGNNLFPFHGQIAEILIFDKKLSNAELSYAETYLALKYGFTLPYNYRSAYAIYFPFVENFGGNIIGVGDFPNWDLKVKKSASQEASALLKLSANSIPINTSLIIGHNKASLTFTSEDVPTNRTRLQRIWKVSKHNNNNALSVDDLSISMNTSLFNTLNTTTNWQLLISDTEDFSDASLASDTIVNGVDEGGGKVVFNNFTLSNKQFFTFSVQGFFISGTYYKDSDLTPNKSGIKISLARNGKIESSATTTLNGKFSLPITQILSKDLFTLFVDDTPGEKAVTISIVPIGGKSYNNINLIRNFIILRGEDLLPINNKHLKELPNDTDATNFVSSMLSSNSITNKEVYTVNIKNNFNLLIPANIIYRPEGDFTVSGDIFIDGTLESSPAGFFGTEKSNEVYKIFGDWVLNDSKGQFIAQNSFVELVGNTQSVFGDNTFYSFKKTVKLREALYFEEAKTQTFKNELILKGGNRENKLQVRTIDSKGLEKNGKLSYVNIQSHKLTDSPTSSNFDYLDIKDNENIFPIIVYPQNSLNSGNTFGWFAPVLSFKSNKTNVQEGDGISGTSKKIEISLQLNAWSLQKTSATLSVGSNSTAVTPSDYDNLQRKFSFPILNPSMFATQEELVDFVTNNPYPEATISLDIIENDEFEIDEQITLTIDENSIINAIINHTKKDHFINILDNDLLPSLTLTLDKENLDEETNERAVITATIPKATSVNTSLVLSLSGEARLHQDYIIQNNIIIIQAGEQSSSVYVEAKNDTSYESVETIDVKILTIENGIENGNQELFINIISNDLPPSVNLYVNDEINPDFERAKEGEMFETNGKVKIFAELDNPSENTVTIRLAALGVAIPNLDYVLEQKIIEIPPGSKRSTFSNLSALDNNLFESKELIIKIANVINGISNGVQTVKVKIIDDDPDPDKTEIITAFDTIIGDGKTSARITVRLKNLANEYLSKSGGIAELFASAGALGKTRDMGDGSYTNLITSSIVNTGFKEVVISVSINGVYSQKIKTIVFASTVDSDSDGVLDYCECPIPDTCIDSDGDGIPNFQDIDSDNDKIPDNIECPILKNCSCNDIDNDGLADYMEHNFLDYDGDYLPDFKDMDSDNDGKTDGEECPDKICHDNDNDNIIDKHDPKDRQGIEGGGDSDNDTITDADECYKLTLGFCIDTDGDAKPNFIDQISNGIRKDRDVCPNGQCGDCDNDHLNDIVDVDDDNNGISDFEERIYQNPMLDFDHDGIINQCDEDDDGDGILDKIECPNGIPCPSTNANKLLPNFLSIDADGDGVLDRDECPTPLNCIDFDKDGIPDYIDKNSDNNPFSDKEECLGISPCPDSDNDGIPNYHDLDANGNGIQDEFDGVTDCDEDGILSFLDKEELCKEVIPLANIFTPNEDGNNDFWYIEGIEKFPNNQVIIFNRLGRKVFEVHQYDNKLFEKRFNGIPNVDAGVVLKITRSQKLPAGTYFFSILLDEKVESVSGYVMIKY